MSCPTLDRGNFCLGDASGNGVEVSFAGEVNTILAAGLYTRKTTGQISGGSASYNLAHGLLTRNFQLAIRNVGTDTYLQSSLYTVSTPTDDDATVTFSSTLASGTYEWNIVG